VPRAWSPELKKFLFNIEKNLPWDVMRRNGSADITPAKKNTALRPAQHLMDLVRQPANPLTE
jgi:hypothetical protein